MFKEISSNPKNSSRKILADFDENNLIKKIKQWLGETNPPSPKGIGDDCAIMISKNPEKYLISTDSIIYKTHFDDSTTAFNAGRKIVLRNLSDIAAMGGKPICATLSILSGKNLLLNWFNDFYEGVRSAAFEYKLKIVGGDLSKSEDFTFSAVMTIIGSSKNPIERHKAEIGDSIYVTGELGGSIYGKHANFNPRIDVGKWLSKNNTATSMIDITDGLIKELPLILNSKSSASINIKSLPISYLLKRNDNSINDFFKRIMTDGEDYELLFSVSSHIKQEELELKWAHEFPNIKLTKIGKVVKKVSKNKVVNSENNQKINLDRGFDHFKT